MIYIKFHPAKDEFNLLVSRKDFIRLRQFISANLDNIPELNLFGRLFLNQTYAEVERATINDRSRKSSRSHSKP